MATIALVDDEENILKSLERSLKRGGWDVLSYISPQVALEELPLHKVDLIISDYRMPEMTGVEFLAQFKQSNPTAIRMVLSGQADIDGVISAINTAEVYRFILKPWNDIELKLTITQALEYNRLKQENERLAQTVKQQSKVMKTQLTELKRLEKDSPGITQVNWNEDGSISLFDDNYSEN